MPSLVSANDLGFSREEKVIFRGVDFTIHAGEILKITGPNGAGKSTLLKVLAGFLTGFDGELSYQGEPLEQGGHFYADVCYLGHQLGVKSNLTVYENMAFFRDFFPSNPVLSIDEVLDQMQLWRLQDDLVSTLSAGQRQRLALSRLVLSQASLWLLDEPFTAVDVEGIGLIERLIAQHASRGGAVVMTSHHTVNLECKHLAMPGFSDQGEDQ
ncbi:MAG: cytochrome c biogenesis heme-transporting ATPase CcmA [Cellvibrionales bacterium]|nr:cytochrome c biogenesis heme-transporting ATPase CcmA [Cellvibrionales bacterium]